MNTFRMMLLGTVAIGMTGLAVDASAAEVTKTMKVSATVNRAVVFTDDGDNTYVKNVVNNTKGDRFRLAGAAKSKNLTVGAKLEFGTYNTNNSNSVNQTNNSAVNGGNANIDNRNAFIYFSSKKYGKLSIGKQSAASDGSAEVDLSGTKTAYYNGNMPNSGFIFLKANEKSGTAGSVVSASAANNPQIKSVMNSFDGLSRKDGVRYDSPKFQGFQVSGGAYEGGAGDVALRYSGKISGTKVAGALSYWNSNGTGTDTADGSGYTATASALHSSGLNATVSYADANKESSTRDDASNLFVRLGYQLKVFGVGKTSMSISYQETKDKGTDQNDFTAYGLALVQSLDAYGTELFVALTKSDLDRGATNWDNITSGIVGAKVEF